MKHKLQLKKCKSGYFIKTHLQFMPFKLTKQYTNADTTTSFLYSALTLRDPWIRLSNWKDRIYARIRIRRSRVAFNYLVYSETLQGFFPREKERTSEPWSNFLFICKVKEKSNTTDLVTWPALLTSTSVKLIHFYLLFQYWISTVDTQKMI